MAASARLSIRIGVKNASSKSVISRPPRSASMIQSLKDRLIAETPAEEIGPNDQRPRLYGEYTPFRFQLSLAIDVTGCSGSVSDENWLSPANRWSVEM